MVSEKEEGEINKGDFQERGKALFKKWQFCVKGIACDATKCKMSVE